MKKILINLLIIVIVGCENPLNIPDDQFVVSASNNTFELNLQLSNDTTDDNTPISFEVLVSRISPMPYYKMMGYWKLYSFNINDENQNISQFPTYLEFRDDQSYTIEEENTITGNTSYTGGTWNYDSAASSLALSVQSSTQSINISFDSEGEYVALDGFMIWEYSDGTNNYKKIYQQTETVENFESDTFLAVDCSGGVISSTTFSENVDIPVPIGQENGDSFNFIGSFEPGLDFDKGTIVVSLYNNDYSTITISQDISIEFTSE